MKRVMRWAGRSAKWMFVETMTTVLHRVPRFAHAFGVAYRQAREDGYVNDQTLERLNNDRQF